MAETPQTTYLKDYTPYPYRIDQLELLFDLEPGQTRVEALSHFCRKDTVAEDTPLVLNGGGQPLLRLQLNGRDVDPGDYELTENTLTLFHPPASGTLRVVTEINPAANIALEGLYLSSGNFCTQCEAQGFRRITYFPDRPDVMCRYTTTIEAHKGQFPVLLSNGNLIDSGELEHGRHFARWEDPFPKPSYLFALVAGDLVCQRDEFTTGSGRRVALEIYVEQRNQHKCDHAMRSLQKAMAWDEQRFGFEYDLDRYMIVAVDDFNMGAMENKGLNVFNSKYVLACPESASDDDFLDIEGVIGHEYFHNWTGNRITCRDWFQLSLKEGLTVFRDQEFSADMNSAAVKRIEEVRLLQTHQFAEDSGPMAHPVRPESYVEINNFYTMTVYNKGAEVIRMLQTLLGRDGFMAGIRCYVERHDGQAVTTDDFVAAMEHATGVDLTQFRRWYSQAGTPRVAASSRYDAGRQQLTLELTQSCPPTPGQEEKQPFHIPLRMALLDRNGQPVALHLAGEDVATAADERVLSLTEPRQSFRFEQVPPDHVLSLLRDFSAPIKLELEHSTADLAFLMAHDTDPFNRWDASQRLATQLLLGLIDDVQQQRVLTLDPSFVAAVAATLGDDKSDPSLLALALTLPLENYLAEQMAQIDPDAIHLAREFVRSQLAQQLKQAFMACYQRCDGTAGDDLSPWAVGRRRLKNLCLSYLGVLEDVEIEALVFDQFSHGDNMTDVSAALSVMADQDGWHSRQALNEFYQRWQHDPLVVDKWLSIQARAKRPDCLEQVERLMGTPAFNLQNPNKVRALIGAFCHGNSVRFHDRSGRGYAFLRQQIGLLDRFNPQVAARLVTPLLRWPRYDEQRRAAMKQVLQQLLTASRVSPDLYEVVTKSLQQEG